MSYVTRRSMTIQATSFDKTYKVNFNPESADCQDGVMSSTLRTHHVRYFGFTHTSVKCVPWTKRTLRPLDDLAAEASPPDKPETAGEMVSTHLLLFYMSRPCTAMYSLRWAVSFDVLRTRLTSVFSLLHPYFVFFTYSVKNEADRCKHTTDSPCLTSIMEGKYCRGILRRRRENVSIHDFHCLSIWWIREPRSLSFLRSTINLSPFHSISSLRHRNLFYKCDACL